VSNLSADSTESLVEERDARPYTATHEDLRTFTRGISAFSRMGDKLAIVLDQNNENVKQLELCYYEAGQSEPSTWDMKAHMTDTLTYQGWLKLTRDYIFLLPEGEGTQIDFSRPITVKRKGRLAGCIDDIRFNDEELNLNERVWSSEFSQLMIQNYGSGWEDKIDEVKTLELDYNITSMQNLMYFPNLEKVILGKNRYMQPAYKSSDASKTDEYVGLVMLSFLKETRPSFTVERYNSHYFGLNLMAYDQSINVYKEAGKVSQALNIEEKGSVNLEEKPEYVPLDTTGWKVTCSDTVFNGYNYNGAAWLLYDGLMHYEDPWMGEWDEEVYFEPAQTLGASIVTVTFDMKTPQTVAGFKVKQPERNESGDKNYLLSSLMIEFSTDNYTWTKATYAEGSATIGNTPAEETFIRVPEDLRTPVRYIRVTMSSRQVSDISGSEIFSLRLGKFIPLKELTLSE